MVRTLEALQRLQDIELKLAEIRRARDVRLRRLEKRKRRVREVEQELRDGQIALRNRQLKIDRLQLDLATREQSIEKHRRALNGAKTNKEYAAILMALNTEKADSAKIEAEALQLMEELQTLKDEAASLEAEKQGMLEDVTKAGQLLDDYDDQFKAEQKGLQARRDKCAEDLEPTTLATFARVAEHHDGEAMAPVAKIHPKREEYVCSGCNMTVTLEVINILRVHSKIQMCKVCGRILYLDATAEAGKGR
ncbi:MAG: zinc ribbon domain-containing protein [Phycisphaerae bacterium]